ncbi:MAG: sugar transporter [Clostridiales bacterium]|jgi:D-proline reductase (dithiol) PrdA|nr:sugar transporter [Clostridiales bacterium]
MSISVETAKEHANDPAVLCCRAEEGTVLEPSNFEDPAIFPDLVDAGLLNLDGALKLGQVLNGSKLTKTVDSLTAITADIVDKFDDAQGDASGTEDDEAVEEGMQIPVISGATMSVSGGVLRLYIGEGKDISIEFPV